MIVSIHIPKTAGTSFGQCMKLEFGERVLFDYGDWAGYNSAQAIAHRAVRAAQMRARRDELLAKFDAIHGHFVADKYMDLFPRTNFIAFFRDPYQQTLSNYYFLLRNPQLQDQHPAVKQFHEAKMTIFDYLSWDEVPDPQSSFLGRVPVESLAMAGLTEEFPRSVVLFNRSFGRKVSSDFTTNVNPERDEPQYTITADLQKAIEKFREADLALYRRARELFLKDCRRRSC